MVIYRSVELSSGRVLNLPGRFGRPWTSFVGRKQVKMSGSLGEGDSPTGLGLGSRAPLTVCAMGGRCPLVPTSLILVMSGDTLDPLKANTCDQPPPVVALCAAVRSTRRLYIRF